MSELARVQVSHSLEEDIISINPQKSSNISIEIKLD